jgi:3-polyprenyl-4-hydroxybenzoate decarboxylase
MDLNKFTTVTKLTINGVIKSRINKVSCDEGYILDVKIYEEYRGNIYSYDLIKKKFWKLQKKIMLTILIIKIQLNIIKQIHIDDTSI